MNASEMVILNGIRDIVENICEGSRGQGVDDYIAVSAGLIERTSNLEYWSEMKDIIHTDHCGVACRVRVGGMPNILRRNVSRKAKERTSYGIVGRVKLVPYWAWLQEIGEERMGEVIEEMKAAEGDIEILEYVKKRSG